VRGQESFKIEMKRFDHTLCYYV